MKISDKLRLIKHEYACDPGEWLQGFCLQLFIFTSVFFLLTLSLTIDRAFGVYLMSGSPNGFYFSLRGLTKADLPLLSRMGFQDISFFSDSDASGWLSSFSGIWIKKFWALSAGKDIWNSSLDEDLGIILFLQIIFGLMACIMAIMMGNILSNSFTLKLTNRQAYIRMLWQLGFSMREIKSIYYGLFSLRSLLALAMSILINAGLIGLLNRYIGQKLHLSSVFPLFSPVQILLVLLLGTILLFTAFDRQWRLLYDRK